MTTVDTRERRGLVLLALGCFAVVMGAGWRLHDVTGPVRMDLRTSRPVFARPLGVPIVPRQLARWFQALGDPVPFGFLVVVLAGAALWLRDRVAAAVAVIGPVFALGMAEAAWKPLFGRTDIVGGADAFPSGHTTAMTALAGVILFVVYRWCGSRAALRALPVAGLLPLSMVLSVVKLHSHVMSDAIGGVFWGVGAVAAVVVVSSSVAERHQRRLQWRVGSRGPHSP